MKSIVASALFALTSVVILGAIPLVLLPITFARQAFAADSSKIKEKAAETTAAVGDYVKDNQDEFEKHMQADVDGLKAQIEVLRAKAMHSSGAVQDKLDKQIADLDVKRMILNKRLGDSAKKSGKAWNEVKSGLSKAFDDLKTSFNKAKETASGVPDAVPPAPAPVAPGGISGVKK